MLLPVTPLSKMSLSVRFEKDSWCRDAEKKKMLQAESFVSTHSQVVNVQSEGLSPMRPVFCLALLSPPHLLPLLGNDPGMFHHFCNRDSLINIPI
jgi:hypothetical protein